jgi:hypothetical protein
MDFSDKLHRAPKGARLSFFILFQKVVAQIGLHFDYLD